MKWPFQTSPAALLELFANRALHLASILILALLARWIVQRAIHASFGRLARASDDNARTARLITLGGLAGSGAAYAIFFIALLMVLTELGLDTKAVLTTAGVLGLAIGLGSQRFVRDVIGGFFILLENQFSVGEMVTLGGPAATGTVQEMGLRVTKLRDDIGRLVIVGNGDITSVTNHSRGPLSVSVDVTLAGDTDLSAVDVAVKDAAERLPDEDWAKKPALLGLVEPPEGKLKVRIAGQATPGRKDPAEMALRAALRQSMAAHNLNP